MKIYFPKSHYNAHRPSVFPLLRPFIKKENFTDAERIKLYGVSEKDFVFTTDRAEADLAILTMAWNYYVKTKQIELAMNFIKECDTIKLKVLAVNVGDFGMRSPSFKNLIWLRFGGYKTKFSKQEFVLPPFIPDPLKVHFNREEIRVNSHGVKPIVGFCGQANTSYLNAGKELSRTFFRNLKFYARWSRNEPQQVCSTSKLRASVLKNIQKSSLVTSNFILRKKYRAGITNNKDNHETTAEFYANLEGSDYIVCLRGAGNFSVRFYETLAMGRIPIFINTDCALPFDDIIDWRRHVVWVEYKDRSKVVEKVVDFHRSLSEREFIDLQYSNRKLWEERLTLDGFFREFIQHNDQLMLDWLGLNY